MPPPCKVSVTIDRRQESEENRIDNLKLADTVTTQLAVTIKLVARPNDIDCD
jgi:hypothetical protein